MFRFSKTGFTLIELLVALAIVAILLILLAMGQNLQLARGQDARRKSDLAKLKVALEDYYNDHNCYPPTALLQNCNSADLAPYVAKIPCDPRTKQPYPYYRDAACNWYAVYTTLQDVSDKVISTLGCSPTCGITGQTYNFLQSNGKLTPTQLAGQINGNGGGGGGGSIACDPSGLCNVYNDPAASGCPVTFATNAACVAACSNPANRCAQ